MSAELNLEAERPKFEAAWREHYKRERGPHVEVEDGKYASSALQDMFVGWCMARRASPAAAVPDGALPDLLAELDKQLDFIVNGEAGAPFRLAYARNTVELAKIVRAAVEADRAQQQDKVGRDSALRAEPAGRVLSAVADMTDEEVAEICVRVRPTDFAGDNDDVDYLRYDAAVIRAVCTELAIRCRAEGGDGAPEAVSADRAQQGEPNVEPLDCDNCADFGCDQCAPSGHRRAATKEPSKEAPQVATKVSAPADAPFSPLEIINAMLLEHDAGGITMATLRDARAAVAAPAPATGIPTCTYPKCNCPFDAPSDPNWCARGLSRPSEAKAGEDA